MTCSLLGLQIPQSSFFSANRSLFVIDNAKKVLFMRRHVAHATLSLLHNNSCSTLQSKQRQEIKLRSGLHYLISFLHLSLLNSPALSTSIFSVDPELVSTTSSPRLSSQSFLRAFSNKLYLARDIH